MSEKTPAIVFAAGALAGQRFEVPASGLRLGRSSHCELAVADPALSRIHCLFEVRNGALWVTDLKSANGTSVNGEALGEEARALAAGDEVVAGETVLRVESAGSATIDLGLGGGGGADTLVGQGEAPSRRAEAAGAGEACAAASGVREGGGRSERHLQVCA